MVLVVAGSLGWYLRGVFWTEEPASDRLIDEAVVAHALYVKEKTHAVEAAADSPNLMRWLSNRIATPDRRPQPHARRASPSSAAACCPAIGRAACRARPRS